MDKQTLKALADIKEKGYVSMETFMIGLGENNPCLSTEASEFLNCSEKDLKEKLITKSFSSEEFFEFWGSYKGKYL